MNLLVTGCAGFIGLNFLKHFVEQNHGYKTIYSVDKMGYATKYNKEEYYSVCKKYNINNINENINSTPKLCCDRGSWDIINFASESHVDNSIKDPNSIFNENVMIPQNIINMVGGIENILRFFEISTDEVYSEIPLDKVSNQDYWFKTTDPIKPNNPYSASKAAQDCYLMAMKHTFGLDVRFIRLANQVGLYQFTEKFFPSSVLRVKRGETIKIYGDGENMRQWTPVDISVKIITDYVLEKIQKRDILHIAFKNGLLTNNEIFFILEEVMNSMGYVVKKEYIKDRLGHDTAYALMTDKEIDNYFKDIELKKYLKQVAEHFIKEEKYLY